MTMTIYYAIYGILCGFTAIAGIQFFINRMSKETTNFFTEVVYHRSTTNNGFGVILLMTFFASILCICLGANGVFGKYYYCSSIPVVVAFSILVFLSKYAEYDKKYDYIENHKNTFKDELLNSKWSVFTKFAIFVWGLFKRSFNPLKIMYFINRILFYTRNLLMLIIVKPFYTPISKERFYSKFKPIFENELNSRFESRCDIKDLTDYNKELNRLIIGMCSKATIFSAMKEKEDGNIYRYYLVRFVNLNSNLFVDEINKDVVRLKMSSFVGANAKLDEKIYLVDTKETKLINKDSEFINVEKSKTKLKVRELYSGYLITDTNDHYPTQPKKEIGESQTKTYETIEERILNSL